MRIGLTGGGSSVDKIVQQAQQAESDGFTSLWYASSVAGDPLVAMTIAGRATTTIELGTAVLQTYPCHPLLQANRVAAAANAMDRPGFALGRGPSHEPVVRDVPGLSCVGAVLWERHAPTARMIESQTAVAADRWLPSAQTGPHACMWTVEFLFNNVLALKERGLLPDAVMRMLVRTMCGSWVKTFECGGDVDKQAFFKKKYFEKLRASAGATHQADANIQHYEVPTRFFELMLGPHLKYSCCLFPESSTSLADAEVAMLHAFLEDHLKLSELVAARGPLRLLDLGCGWGSHGGYVLDNYDDVHVTFLSNSATQQDYIKARNSRHAGRFSNVKADASEFDDPSFREAFDVIVSCEMLEHMKNYDMVLKKVSSWLTPDGAMMVQILGNRRFAYDFKTTDWMGKYFFAGGTMPSRDLFEYFLPPDLKQTRVWDIDGRQYSTTLDAWLAKLDANSAECLRALQGGPTSASIALQRWRMFLLFCSEVFGYRDGNEWMVFHYLFEKTPAALTS